MIPRRDVPSGWKLTPRYWSSQDSRYPELQDIHWSMASESKAPSFPTVLSTATTNVQPVDPLDKWLSSPFDPGYPVIWKRSMDEELR